MKKAYLEKLTLFKGLKKRDIGHLAGIARIIKNRKGSYIFRENEPGNALYLILSGIVKIFMISSNGRKKTLAILKKDDFFGEMAGLDRSVRSATSQALEDTELLYIRQKDFEGILKNNPAIAINIITTLTARLRSADRQIEDLVFKNVLGRIGSSLLSLALKHGIKTNRGIRISLRLSHSEIADMAGTARELATKAISKLKKNGCIKVVDNSIYVNSRKLKEWIH